MSDEENEIDKIIEKLDDLAIIQEKKRAGLVGAKDLVEDALENLKNTKKKLRED